MATINGNNASNNNQIIFGLSQGNPVIDDPDDEPTPCGCGYGGGGRVPPKPIPPPIPPTITVPNTGYQIGIDTLYITFKPGNSKKTIKKVIIILHPTLPPGLDPDHIIAEIDPPIPAEGGIVAWPSTETGVPGPALVGTITAEVQYTDGTSVTTAAEFFSMT